MWRREMEWLVAVSDHIVELRPSWQTFHDGSKLEVMTSRPRADLFINLPALRKLDNMLIVRIFFVLFFTRREWIDLHMVRLLYICCRKY